MTLPHTLTPTPTLTLHLCPTDPPTYETPDGCHTLTYVPGVGWMVDDHTSLLWPFPQNAADALARALTRYTYDPALGEQCAVCGQPRGADQMQLGWWWHTACRVTTDPDGAATHNAPPTHDQPAARP